MIVLTNYPNPRSPIMSNVQDMYPTHYVHNSTTSRRNGSQLPPGRWKLLLRNSRRAAFTSARGPSSQGYLQWTASALKITHHIRVSRKRNVSVRVGQFVRRYPDYSAIVLVHSMSWTLSPFHGDNTYAKRKAPQRREPWNFFQQM